MIADPNTGARRDQKLAILVREWAAAGQPPLTAAQLEAILRWRDEAAALERQQAS